MPSGVEHYSRRIFSSARASLIVASMPSGVEHLFRKVKHAATAAADRRLDALGR